MQAQTFALTQHTEIVDEENLLRQMVDLLVIEKKPFSLQLSRAEDISTPGTTAEIEAFFRSFKVDASGYKFDRDEANARLPHH